MVTIRVQGTSVLKRASQTKGGDMEAYKRYQPSACPHLGTFEDPETHFSFAAASNYCYHAAPPEMIDLTHQEVYCLSDEYKICPKFLHELLDQAAEPAALLTESSGFSSTRSNPR